MTPVTPRTRTRTNAAEDSPFGDYMTLAQAAEILPGRPHPSAVWRWVRHGQRNAAGERVYLRAARLGRHMFTKIEWLQDFADAAAAGTPQEQR